MKWKGLKKGISLFLSLVLVMSTIVVTNPPKAVKAATDSTLVLGEFDEETKTFPNVTGSGQETFKSLTVGFNYSVADAENITLPTKLDGRDVDEQRLNDLLKTLGLEKRKYNLPNQLSGGQQQRVSIGRAMMNEPALMLADEPTGNLDSKASEEIISLLRLSNKKYNQTVIVITHDEKIALEADRVITIDDGRIIKDERTGK